MSKSTVSGEKHQELPQRDPVALRRLARLFDGLADDARDALSAAADGISTGAPFWRDASKLLCQASDAGAQFDFWPDGRTPRGIESSLRRLDKSEADRGKIRFPTIRPTHFIGLIWLSAVKGLAESFPECFERSSPETFIFPSPGLEGPGELYWWQQHWKVQRRACQLMASLLHDYPAGQDLRGTEKHVVEALRKSGRRMTTDPLLSKAVGKVNSHGKITLSGLVKRGILDKGTDARGKGYGLPSWSGP